MTNARHAVILAAGEGNRLRPLTDAAPKPLVPVNGRPMLDRAIAALRQNGVERFTIVVGHLEQVVRDHLAKSMGEYGLSFVSNPAYRKTNSMFSLLLGLAHVDEAIWIVEGDVVFDAGMLAQTPSFPITWVVDTSARHLDGAFVLADANGAANAVEIVLDIGAIKPGAGKSVGIVHVAANALGDLRHWLIQDLLERREKDYYDLTLGRRLPVASIGTLDIAGYRWYEVDNQADLAKAESMFP